MLRACREHDALGMRLEAAGGQPRGHGLPMAQVAAGGHVAEELRPRQHAPRKEMLLENGHLLVRHEDVHAQIDRAAAGIVIGLRGAADERAAPDVAGNQPAARRFGVGACDGRDRDAKPIGEIPVRRQSRSGAQGTFLHVVIDGIRDRAVHRPLAALNLRKPHCHAAH
jgi:hypothetical protein